MWTLENILLAKWLFKYQCIHLLVKLGGLIATFAFFIVGIWRVRVERTMDDTIKYIAFLVVHLFNIMITVQSITLVYQRTNSLYFKKFMQIKDHASSAFNQSINASFCWDKCPRGSLFVLIFVVLICPFGQLTVLAVYEEQQNFKYEYIYYTIYPNLMIRINFAETIALIEIVHVLLQVIVEEARRLLTLKTSPLTSNVVFLIKLINLKTMYQNVHELHINICAHHSWTLLGAVVSFFLGISFNIYFLYVSLHEGNGYFLFFVTIFDIPLPFILLVILCRSCFKCSKKALDILRIIEQLSPLKYWPEEQCSSQVEAFILQILHAPFAFSVHNFVRINHRLFYSIMITSITFVTVLIQFHVLEGDHRVWH